MNRFSSFLMGIIVGCALMYTALKYHVVRAESGFHLVPKVTGDFAEAYVDIREFKLSDWEKHRSLGAALVKANKGDLLKDAAGASFRESLENVLDNLRGKSGK